MSHSIGRRPLLAALPVAAVLTGAAHAEGDPLTDTEGHLHHQELQARERHGDARDHDRLRDLRHAGAGRPQRRAADPRLHLEPAHGRAAPAPNGAEGSWDGLVGPGKAIDTDRLFVVSSNMLGSSYGSTNPGLHQPRDRQALRPGLPRHHPGRHRQRAEGAARQPRRQAPGRGRRPVVRRLPDLPVGRHLSRLHGRAGGGGQRAQGLGRRGGGEVAGRPPRQGSQLERRLVLRQGRHRRRC